MKLSGSLSRFSSGAILQQTIRKKTKKTSIRRKSLFESEGSIKLFSGSPLLCLQSSGKPLIYVIF
jgi:hypothetical protein